MRTALDRRAGGGRYRCGSGGRDGSGRGRTDRRRTATGADVSGAEVIDATGNIVAPGFIDLHSHADFTAQTSPDASTQLYQVSPRWSPGTAAGRRTRSRTSTR